MADTTPKPPISEAEGTVNFRGIPIKVTVGASPKSEDFYIHERVLVSHSAFFKTALSKPCWQESQDRSINLSHDDPEIFYIYVHYLYTNTLQLDSQTASGTSTSTSSDQNLTLCALYVLGEKLISPHFQDLVLDALVYASRIRDPATNRRSVPLKSDKVNLVYDGTPPGSPLRRLLVDMAVCCGNSGWDVVGQEPPYCREFLAELCGALMAKRKIDAEFLEEYAELIEGVPVSYHKVVTIVEGEDGEDGERKTNAV